MSFHPEMLRIRTPCPVKWSSMVGTGNVRFCGKCQQKVYDLTGLEPAEISALILRYEGRRICTRFYARKDDRVMVRGCPLAVKLERRWEAVIAGGGAFAVAAVLLISIITFFGNNIRSQFAMTSGALAGDDRPYVPPSPPSTSPAGHQAPDRRPEHPGY